MKPIWYVAGIAALAVLAYLTSLLVGGAAATETVADVTYLCRETGQVVTAPPQPTPAVNPQTGRRTLYRALYCSKCQAWRAVPPSQVYGGNPLSNVCPRHREPMSPTGPLTNRANQP